MLEQDFVASAGDWTQLLAEAPQSSVFQTSAWLHTWWEQFGGGKQLAIVTVTHEGQLVGLAPLMRAEGRLLFVADPDICDYHDFLVRDGQHQTFFTALLTHLGGQGVRQVELAGLRDGSPTLEALPPIAHSLGFSVERVVETVSPAAELPGDWDSYIQSLGKKDRHELRRKLRRLETTAPGYRFVALGDGRRVTNEDLSDFLSLLTGSREDKRQFLTPERERFFRSLSLELDRQGSLRLAFLEADGKRVATALCFAYNGVFSLYNSGYDHAYAHLSVGLLVKALCIKEAIAQGAHRFDFLRGAEPYKYDLGGKDVTVSKLLLTRQ
ncbi:MAG: GNAT family N-acetyltransferase [Chloroflexi bacterium]|nr:GNAT family N-acetyltransferase [Chloroflexota bacterium]